MVVAGPTEAPVAPAEPVARSPQGRSRAPRPPRSRFTRAELGLVGSTAGVVFTRVFAFSLTTLGFTEFAAGLAPAGTSQGTAKLLAGIALGAYAVTMALAQLATGYLSDRVGRRPVLLWGTALFVLGAAVCAVNGDGGSIWVLIAGRLLQGLGGVSSVAMAALGETVPEERRTMAMAMVGVPAGIGVFLGFILGPTLLPVVGWTGLFWMTAALGMLASVGFVVRPLPPAMPGLAHPRRSLERPVIALALAGFCVNFAMNATMFDIQTSVLDPLGHTWLAVILVAAFVVMGGVSRAVDRSRASWQPILASLVVLAAAAPLFRLGHGVPVWVAAGIAFFAAHATLSAVLPSQVSRLAGRSGGLGHGIQLVVAYLGSAAGATLAGLVWPQLVDAFAVLAVLAAVACLLVVTSLREANAAAAMPQV